MDSGLTVNVCVSDGSGCKRTWDGWLCWDDLDAGFTSAQHCPDYYDDFDTSGESHHHITSMTGPVQH